MRYGGAGDETPARKSARKRPVRASGPGPENSPSPRRRQGEEEEEVGSRGRGEGPGAGQGQGPWQGHFLTRVVSADRKLGSPFRPQAPASQVHFLRCDPGALAPLTPLSTPVGRRSFPCSSLCTSPQGARCSQRRGHLLGLTGDPGDAQDMRMGTGLPVLLPRAFIQPQCAAGTDHAAQGLSDWTGRDGAMGSIWDRWQNGVGRGLEGQG